MADEPEEIDYLAGTKPYPKIPSFAEEIKEAFALEHHCFRDQEFAPFLGVSTGRVSQIINNPKRLKAESVHKLLACFSSLVLRRRIFKAWQRECFGDELLHGEPGSIVGAEVTEATIKRVDRLVRTQQPDRALEVTEVSLTMPLDPALRRQFLDRAYYLYNRLDQCADALRIAQIYWDEAIADNRREDQVVSLAMQARIMRSMDGISIEALRDLHRRTRELLDALPRSALSAHGGIEFQKRLLQSERIAVTLKDHRPGASDETLREALRLTQVRVQAADSPGTKSRAMREEAQIHLKLKEYFKAEDLLEAAFPTGDLSLGSDVYSGLLKARIIAARGDLDEAIAYYTTLCSLCESRRYLYLLRLCQRDLALLLYAKHR